ncbi:MAG: hypothetical protein R3B84_22175 [Zavarzinella sp.]
MTVNLIPRGIGAGNWVCRTAPLPIYGITPVEFGKTGILAI